MSCYEALAGSYDALTEDVGYGKRLDFIEKLLCRSRIPVKLVLDLACGTGTMSWLLTQQGYEVIGVDGSEDMLAAAISKGGETSGVPPVFLHQSMPKLDLYGTVDWRRWTVRYSWMRRRIPTACGGRSTTGAFVPTTWTCSAAAATAHGAAVRRCTGSGPTLWRN